MLISSVIGIHGTERLVGNGLLESIVFGTTAGTRAAKTSQHDVNTTTLPEWTPLKLRHRAKVLHLFIRVALIHILCLYRSCPTSP
jgi:aspartate oxidase